MLSEFKHQEKINALARKGVVTWCGLSIEPKPKPQSKPKLQRLIPNF